jgi:hypothetical protein
MAPPINPTPVPVIAAVIEPASNVLPSRQPICTDPLPWRTFDWISIGGIHAPLVVIRRGLAEGRMPAMRVVPAFDEVEDREPCVVVPSRSDYCPAAHSSVALKLSHIASLDRVPRSGVRVTLAMLD